MWQQQLRCFKSLKLQVSSAESGSGWHACNKRTLFNCFAHVKWHLFTLETLDRFANVKIGDCNGHGVTKVVKPTYSFCNASWQSFPLYFTSFSIQKVEKIFLVKTIRKKLLWNFFLWKNNDIRVSWKVFFSYRSIQLVYIF